MWPGSTCCGGRPSGRSGILFAALAAEKGYRSIALPLIGAGSGGFNQERAKEIMLDELQKLDSPLEVTVVVYRRA